jgi:SAM-dependent methyltransferase
MFEHADAENHPFVSEDFDVVVSRFGTMFFRDPVAGFANIGRALRPAGRLVMMVWQASEQNEWFVAIEEALGGRGDEPTSEASDTFSLANPAKTEEILDAAGFADANFIDVHRPIYFGRDVTDALEWVHGFTSTRESLVRLGPPSAERALGRLQKTLVAHAAADGVWFDARAWIVKAHRG